MSPASAFQQIWSNDKVCSSVLSYLPKDDWKNLRLASKDLSVTLAPHLFREKHVHFKRGLFTKRSWLAMLDRLGPHVRTFHFHMPHSSRTTLPPLIDDEGKEVAFVYDPYTGSNKKAFDFVPPYGSQEMYNLLTKQWPTIFHAAANVPSFIRVFSSLTNVRHLKISTPGQARSEAYLRSAVDYALISLRIAVERNRLLKLRALSLLSVHPGAAFYLNPLSGFGARPNSLKRWRQIRMLKIEMDTPPTCTLPDHLKFCHNYLDMFQADIKHIDFRWLGAHAPWPLSLHNEPTPNNARCRTQYPNVTHLCHKRLWMPRLRTVTASNTVVDASQVSAFLEQNRFKKRCRKGCSLIFEESTLRSGTWEDAIRPFKEMSGKGFWHAATNTSKPGLSPRRKEEIARVEVGLKCARNGTSAYREAIDIAGLDGSEVDGSDGSQTVKSYQGDAAPDRGDTSERADESEVPIIMSPVELDDGLFKPEPETLKPVCYDPLRNGRVSKLSPLLGLHKAGSRTIDLLHETEGHVRELFRASIFTCWQRNGSSSIIAAF